MLKFVCLCAVCSKTLWIGRLNKHTTEQELSSELSQFGKISSINVSYAWKWTCGKANLKIDITL